MLEEPERELTRSHDFTSSLMSSCPSLNPRPSMSGSVSFYPFPLTTLPCSPFSVDRLLPPSPPPPFSFNHRRCKPTLALPDRVPHDCSSPICHRIHSFRLKGRGAATKGKCRSNPLDVNWLSLDMAPRPGSSPYYQAPGEEMKDQAL